VDDNLAVADSLALVLSLAGNEVQIAYDGQSALETAASFQPDVILLDIGLPEMNGYEVARQLRQRNRNGRVVLLIAMTGYGQDEHLLRSREVGFDAHLVKPVDFVALQKLLSELIPRTS
jgi:CheY-like chemotaxis protein